MNSAEGRLEKFMGRFSPHFLYYITPDDIYFYECTIEGYLACLLYVYSSRLSNH